MAGRGGWHLARGFVFKGTNISPIESHHFSSLLVNCNRIRIFFHPGTACIESRTISICLPVVPRFCYLVRMQLWASRRSSPGGRNIAEQHPAPFIYCPIADAHSSSSTSQQTRVFLSINIHHGTFCFSAFFFCLVEKAIPSPINQSCG